MNIRILRRFLPRRLGGHASRGVAIIEFAFVLPLVLILILISIDFGRLVQTRLTVSNVSREGGSVASREPILDNNMLNLLQSTATPYNLRGADGQVWITRITAGADKDDPNPSITTQLAMGSLGVGSRANDPSSTTLGLTQKIYDHLIFKELQGSADISNVTIVEVSYKYRPITPLPNFIRGALLADDGGTILTSRAVF